MITFNVIERFFDRPAVVNAIDSAKRKQLSRAGAYVRTTARRSIRPAGKRAVQARPRRGDRFRRANDPTVSRPGQPPRLHTSAQRNLKLILFAWEPARQSVIVGPVLFKSSSGVRIPEVLEHGGRSYVKGRFGRKKSVRIRPRPFMKPALQKEASKFPDLFSNSVRP
jgi:hypothetical protein